MAETKELLERARNQFPPPEDVMGALIRRRDRRRRNQRIAAGTLGIGIVLAGLLIATNAIRSASVPVGPTPRPSVSQDRGVVPPGSFDDVRGWISYRGGGSLMAVDPENPANRLMLGHVNDADPIGWSSDGSQLLLRSGVHLDSWSYPARLFSLRSDGTTVTLLRTSGSGKGGDIPWAVWGSFSPDGRQVTFACCGTEPGPFVVDADGGPSRPLVDRCEPPPVDLLPGACGEPLNEAATWSPDGTKIAWLDFVEDSPTYGHHARVLSFVKPDGTGLRTEVLQVNTAGMSLLWSPDGSQLLTWDESGAIVVIDPDRSEQQVLLDEGENRWAVWSPDGSRIAFVRDGSLYTMSADGTDIREIEGVHPEGAIAWNPVA